MNIQLNSKQFIQLYDLVVSTVSICQDVEKKSILTEIKLKLSEKLTSILSEIEVTDNSKKLSTWIQKESEKIDNLTQDLVKIRQVKMVSSLSQDDGLYYPPEIKT